MVPSFKSAISFCLVIVKVSIFTIKILFLLLRSIKLFKNFEKIKFCVLSSLMKVFVICFKLISYSNIVPSEQRT